MLRPRMNAAKLSIDRNANSSSRSVDPPPWPCIARNLFVWKNHWNISGPRFPSGLSILCSGPALKPSKETPKPATRTCGMWSTHSSDFMLAPEEDGKALDHHEVNEP